jgi:hypothetical protein
MPGELLPSDLAHVLSMSPITEHSVTLNWTAGWEGVGGPVTMLPRAGKVGDYCRLINHPSNLPEGVPEVNDLLDAAVELDWWEPNGLPVELQTTRYLDVDLDADTASLLTPHEETRQARRATLLNPDTTRHRVVTVYLTEYGLRTLPVDPDTAHDQLADLAAAADAGHLQVRLVRYFDRTVRLIPAFRRVTLADGSLTVVLPAITTTTLVSGATHYNPYRAALAELARLALSEAESLARLHDLAMDTPTR